MKDINKDIEILENLLEEGFEAMCYPEAQAIEHLIQAYKELEEENMQLETIKNETIRRYNFETIPIQKVKDKIETLKKTNVNGEIFTTAVNFAILTLQELIEEREEK